MGPICPEPGEDFDSANFRTQDIGVDGCYDIVCSPYSSILAAKRGREVWHKFGTGNSGVTLGNLCTHNYLPLGRRGSLPMS